MTLTRVVPLVVLAAVAAGAAGCSGAPRIEIDGQEARPSPVLVGVCSIFMRIGNTGDGDDTLLSARVDVPGAITEVHEVRGGRMVKAEKVSIPARGVVELRPGGLHLMVFHLPKGAGAGYALPVRLVFATSGEKLTTVTIRG